MKRVAVWLSWVGLLLGVLGCGGGARPKVTEADVAGQKLEAMKRLADELAKGANSPEAMVALDEFRMLPLNVQQHAKEAREILEIYQKRIEGKYSGEVVNQLQMELTQIQANLRAGGGK